MRKGERLKGNGDGVHVTPVLVETVTGDGGLNKKSRRGGSRRRTESRGVKDNRATPVDVHLNTRIGGLKMPSELPAGMFCSLFHIKFRMFRKSLNKSEENESDVRMYHHGTNWYISACN